MNTRRLLSNTLVYGVADVAVLAVGGLLLLPLYTRTLTQQEFGVYVIVRANTEILTYVLYFGLPSAVARVYFDYRKRNEHVDYLSSVLMLFLANLAVVGGILWLWGSSLWTFLSPTTPVDPYLGFSVAIAAVSFFSALGSIWLRVENRPVAFAGLQVFASIILAGIAVLNLAVLDRGLAGLLYALLISSAASASVLPWLFRGSFRPVIRRAHVADSLRYAMPILVGYIAYFVLNRISTLILQRHVSVDQIAIFGLAQQLSLMLTIVATAFAKASQPMVFAAAPAQAAELLERSGKILTVLMFGVASAFVLFAGELFAVVAPKSYASGHQILLILLVASFAYSFTLVSDTALLYHRRPKTSVAVSLVGAGFAALLGNWLIPRYQLHGAALAIAGAFLAMTLLSHAMARHVTGHSYFATLVVAVASISALACAVAWFAEQGWPSSQTLFAKAGVAATIFVCIYLGMAQRRRHAA